MQRTQVIRFAAFVAVLAVLLGYVVYHRTASVSQVPKSRVTTVKAKAGSTVTSLENYFVNYRMQRDQMMSREVATIENLLKEPGLSRQAKDQAASTLVRDQQELKQEMDVEGLLSARGFPLSAVTISDSRVDVIIGGSNLSQEDVARIADTVNRVTNLPPENVVILPKN
ncbi:MAG: SpoIIIAH-like family protein [Firmicutes bacterium]|jgi:stage III sporulation protein AH|nr:SpoIIIAH-like family protein [Bacillota bacterium]MCL5065456.1 SpoIIIAH-like family protein [Bacillota bacterium]